MPEAADPIRAVLDGGGEAWLSFWQRNMEVPGGMAERLRDNDCEALLLQWEQPYPWRDDVLPLLADFPFPCLLYAGDAEPVTKGMKVCAQEMPRAEFVALATYGHFDVFANPGSILPHVERFLHERMR